MKLALISIVLLAAPVQDDTKTITVADVIDWVSRETGRKFMYDEQIEASYGRKHLFISPDTLDRKRAYEIGLSLLRTVTLAAIQTEEGIRLVPGQTATREALKVYESVDALPKADEFCTLTLKLVNAPIREAHQALINLSNPMGIQMLDSQGMLLLSDYTSNLRRMADVVRRIDVPRTSDTWAVQVSLLEGLSGAEAAVPEAYRALDLPKVTGRNRFTPAGDAMIRIVDGDRKVTKGAMRLDGARPLLAELTMGPGAATDFALVIREVAVEKEGNRLVETNLEMKDGAWVMAGWIPGTKEGSVLAVLVKITRLPS